MRQVIYMLLFLGFSQVSLAEKAPQKTFLILFDQSELATYRSSAAKMELNFMDSFKTRTYTGNSEHALIVTVPFSDWTVCEMGSSLVRISEDREVPLESIAFRIIDMNACQENFQSLLSESEDQSSGKKVATIKLTL